MINLTGKVSWVTGASGSIGRATCFALAKAGSALFITDISVENLEKLKIELEEFTSEVTINLLDVSNSEEVAKMEELIMEEFGRLDILVNCAGISPKGKNGRIPVEELDVSDWYRVLECNLFGAFYCSQVAARLMKKVGLGHIVNISSQAARSYSAVVGAHYAVSKSGLISLTRQMAGELGPAGIYVNAVAPGRIDTPMTRDVAPEVNKKISESIPLRRMGDPEEVAETILFLVTGQSSYITGAVIDINGGRLMV